MPPNPPVDPSLEERAVEEARKLLGRNTAYTIEDVIRAYLRVASTDHFAALLSARSDEVVVTLDAEELAQAARWCGVIGAPRSGRLDLGASLPKDMKRVAAAQKSLRSKLSTALESE